MEIWEPKPPGALWATPGLLRDSFTFFNSTTSFYGLNFPPNCQMNYALMFYLHINNYVA